MSSPQCLTGVLSGLNGRRRVSGRVFVLLTLIIPTVVTAAPAPGSDGPAITLQANPGPQLDPHDGLAKVVFLQPRTHVHVAPPNVAHPVQALLSSFDQRIASIPSQDGPIGLLIQYLNTRSDKERLAGLVQVLTIVDLYGTPGHNQRVRNLPVRVQERAVVVVNGKQAVFKRYVHRSGATRDVLFALSAPPAAPAGPGPAAEPVDLEITESMRSADAVGHMQNAAWCEYYDDELGDLSGECATEQEIDDFIAFLMSLTVEVGTLNTVLGSAIDEECFEASTQIIPDPEYAELCGFQLTQVSLAYVTERGELDISDVVTADLAAGAVADLSAQMQHDDSMPASCDSAHPSIAKNCVDEALFAIIAFGYAVIEVNKISTWAATGLTGHLARFTVRAIALKGGAAAIAAAAAAYGVYSYLDCRRDGEE